MRKIFLTLLPLVLFVNCEAVAEQLPQQNAAKPAQVESDKTSPDALRDEAKDRKSVV